MKAETLAEKYVDVSLDQYRVNDPNVVKADMEAANGVIMEHNSGHC
jgi:uncharacterized surface protein with fasciclin (FAS1) repeats